MAGAELPGSKPSPRLRAIQWTAVALVTVVIALNYIDRSTLSVGNLLIRKEFGISATAIGALQSGWSLAYAFAQIPVGFMLDRLGPRYLVGGALILWSIAQGAGGFAFGYTQLLWTRIALGITESPASASPATGFVFATAACRPVSTMPAVILVLRLRRRY